ncbi:MAG: ABC transporter substrate-binding protein [Polaromonas sp.]|nr:ABC transporter substrate-binding protein [Polaromonas sp.]
MSINTVFHIRKNQLRATGKGFVSWSQLKIRLVCKNREAGTTDIKVPVPRLYVAAAGIFCILALSGPLRAEVGVTSTEIHLGQSTALTGPQSHSGTEFTSGAKLQFDDINSRGGVHGRRIKLTTLDDGYQPEKSAENVAKLISEGEVFSIFGVLGAPNTATALPVASNRKVPFLFPMNGDPAIRRVPNRYYFTAHASFEMEAEKIVDQLTLTGIRKIGVAHLDNPYGKGILAAVRKSLEQRQLTPAGVIAFDISGKDASVAADALYESKPNAIILGGAGKAIPDFIAAYQKKSRGTRFIALSGVGSDFLIKTLGPASAGIVVSQTMPYPWALSASIVRDYQRLKSARDQSAYNYINLLGFVSARVLTEALQRTGKELTRERLISTLESMRLVDLGGFVVDFSPENHHGSKLVDLTFIDGKGKFVK